MKSIIKKFKEYFWKEHWNIAVFKGNISDFVEGKIKQKDLNWLFGDKENGFCADPFLIEYEDKIFLFFEEFEYKKQKGRIMVSELTESSDGKINAGEKMIVYDYEKHLSYPFVFVYNEVVYMIPETSSENEIALYKATNFPLKWEKEKVLIPNFAGIDTTLHFSQNKWWIFCSNDKIGCNESLYIFYADDLFGKWESHNHNPVKLDLGNSRMAGPIFCWGNKIVRPAQNCKETYGKEIVLNEIKKISTEDFDEEALGAFAINDKSLYSKGMHTISSSENFVAIDAKKFFGARKYLDVINWKRKAIFTKLRQVFQKDSQLDII